MVVRMRANRSKRGKRRSHQALTGARVSLCECGASRLPHRACASCGKYNGRVIIDVVARAQKEVRRSKRRDKALRESGQITSEKEKTAT
jgi:large subunit ribosomal protein L32